MTKQRKIKSDKCPGLVGHVQNWDKIHEAIQSIDFDRDPTKENKKQRAQAEIDANLKAVWELPVKLSRARSND